MHDSKLKHTSIAIIAIAAMVYAWSQRFVCDDAYISFTYARNLASGHGLVFHPTLVPVEGYTNFLWTLLLALAPSIGVSMETWAHVLSLSAFGGSIWILGRLAADVGLGARATIATIAVFSFSSTTVTFATSGLETSLHLFLILLILWRARDVRSLGRQVALGLMIAAAMMVRLDSALLAVPVGLAILWRARGGSFVKAIRPITIVAGVPSLIVGLWFIWKLHFYGDILPNTFYVKFSSGYARGLVFVGIFAAINLVPLTWLATRTRRLELFRRVPIYTAFSLLWLAYVVKVGGGFMQFRMLVPIVPLIALWVGWAVEKTAWDGVVITTALLVVSFLVGSLSTPVYDIWPRESMHRVAADQLETGERLQELLGPSDLTVTEGAVGGLALGSNYAVVDVFGLNDREISRTPQSAHSNVPGHRKIASYAYLQERGVNLAYVRRHQDPSFLEAQLRRESAHWEDAKAIISSDGDIGFVYVTPHADIERAILDGRLHVIDGSAIAGSSVH